MENVIRKVAGWGTVAGVAIFGGVTAFGDDTTRNERNEIVEAGGLGAFAIEIGDCLNLPSELDVVQSVEGVPCGEPHNAQAFAKFNFVGTSSEEYPGPDAFELEASLACNYEFEGFVGIPYEDSAFGVLWLHPTEESWVQLDDREIVCLVESAEPISFDARATRR